MGNSEIYQIILDSLLSLGFSQWEKIVFYSQYDKNSFEMKFFVKNGETYKDCFSLGIPDKTIVNMFIQLDKEISRFRKLITDDKQELWTAMTIIFDSDLQFKAEFDYNVIEDVIPYKSEWKKKYLKT